MGRKKRKVEIVGEDPDGNVTEVHEVNTSQAAAALTTTTAPKEQDETKASSGYAMTTHSAEIVDEDIYISDGSESDVDLMAEPPEPKMDEEEQQLDEEAAKEQARGRSIEMLLGSSKMGLMRRGIHHHSLLMQPNRQWSRAPKETAKAATAEGEESTAEDAAAEEERRKKQEEEELAKLDPAQRAAILLAKKQRLLEEAKIHSRKMESAENAGRDPLLFSKRTSFDIRFDQIDDKPWTRGGDMSDYFNYGFSEEQWIEYSEQQLQVRQELTDASRQKRPPDPSIVPVAPKAPKKQNPKVAVTSETGGVAADNDDDGMDGNAPVAGPQAKSEKEKSKDTTRTDEAKQGPAKAVKEEFTDVNAGVGGAWGTAAVPGSKLAQLIEEQERQFDQQQGGSHPGGRDSFGQDDASYSRGGGNEDMSVSSSQYGGGPRGGGFQNQPYHHHHQQQRGQWDDRPPPGGHGEWNGNGGGGYGGPPQGGNWNDRGGGCGGGGAYDNNYGGPPPPQGGWDGGRGGGRGGFRGGRGGGRFGGRGRGGRGGRGDFYGGRGPRR